MEIKKYLDIERCKESYASTFEVGEPIVIQVKIDGSNASIAYDSKTNSLVAFSRRQALNEMNTLNGFWNYVQSLDVKAFAEILGDRYIIFGEWLVPHSVKYPEDMYKKFYMFDVWDRETEQYLTQEDSLAIFDRLKNYIPNYVHTLYNGPFISWEHTLAFLKENIYGEAPCMEGIVIKRQDKLWSKSSRLPYYVKVVNEKFSEVHSSKPKTIDPEKLAAREAEQAAVLGDMATAAERLDAITREYNSRRDKIKMFFHHDDLDEMEKTLITCRDLVAMGQSDNLICEIDTILGILDHMDAVETITIAELF